MKKICTLSFLALGAFALSAQVIPNAGFESWVAGVPAGWTVNNTIEQPFVVETNDAHEGNKAARLNVYDLGGFTLSGILSADDVPQTTFPDGLHGWYKGVLAIDDQFSASTSFNNAGSNIVGAGSFLTEDVTNIYTEFEVVTNILSANPATVNFSFLIINFGGNVDLNSYIIIDDLSWGPSSVEEFDKTGGFALEQLLPNPVVGDACMVQYRLEKNAAVEMNVYDLQGKQVVSAINLTQSPGHYRAELNTAGLESGYYIVSCMVDGVRKTLPLIKN